MDIISIINKKKNGKQLNKEEISFAVMGYVNGDVFDYQMSSLLMAIVLNGMTDREVFDLTDVMINSGDKIDLSFVNGTIVDKHSTGGIGDKTTLVLAPLVASCGVKVAKMSGRGLGYTGGTIDKLESIEGFNVKLSFDDFIKQVNNIGVAIVSQMGNLVPADKKIYALRDVSGTVDSIPLIASSIMSKKIASGAKKIVIDVKVGEGALMTNIVKAKELANLMIRIGKKYDREVVCEITDMNTPLGCAIGNSLEVLEAIDTLKGNGPKDLEELVISLASYMVSLGLNVSLRNAKKTVIKNLNNNKAYEKFIEFVKAQGGNIELLPVSSNVISIKSNKSGVITDIDALKIGKISNHLGAGRKNLDDNIDYGVGIVLNKKLGDIVTDGDELCKVYLGKTDVALSEIVNCFKIGSKRTKQKLIKYIIK